MKKIIASFFAIVFLATVVSLPKASAVGSPMVATQNPCLHPHPNDVACYASGSHAIVGETDLHYGSDEVWADGQGNSNNFTQVFMGTGDTGKLEREMSQWISTSTNTCGTNGIFIQNARESGWGDYFPPNTNYCVYTNEGPIQP